MNRKMLLVLGCAVGWMALPVGVKGQEATPYLAAIQGSVAGDPAEGNGCGAVSEVTEEAGSFYLAERPTAVLSAMTEKCGLLWFECTGDACQQMAADEAARKYGAGEQPP